MNSPEVLRGRSDEMVRAMCNLRAARRKGQGQILIVTGEQGVGKSMLAAAIDDEARAQGFRTGRSTAEAESSLGAPMLSVLCDGLQPGGERSARFGVLSEEPMALVESVSNLLADAAESNPLLLKMDDLEHADQLTRFLLRTVPSRLASLPIVWLLVGRAQPGTVLSELSSPSKSRSGQIAVECLELGPLSAEAVAAIERDCRMSSSSVDRVRGLEQTAVRATAVERPHVFR